MDPADLFRSFRRALRAHQLYPEGSRVRIDAAERLVERFVEALEHRPDGISLAFLEEGAFLDGQALPVEPDDGGGPLAQQLFELGVRELRFLPGLTAREMGDLLDVLTRAKQGALDPVDEDLSILLWEADLLHVSYLLYDSDPLLPTAEGEADGSEDPLEGETPLSEYIDDDAITVEATSSTTWIPLSEPERLGLLASYRQEVEEEIPYKYGRLLLEILRSESDAAEIPRLQRVLREYLEALVAAGRFQILKRIEASLDGPEPELEPTRLALRATRRLFEEPALYVRAAEIDARAHETDRVAAQKFLEAIPARAVPEVVSLLLDERATPNGEALERVRQRLRLDGDARRACLEDSRRPVQRFAIEEEGPLEEDGARKVRELLKDPDASLRQLAARALGGAQGKAALAALGEALVDPDGCVRMAAASSLSKVGGPKALELLLRVVVSKEFGHRDLEEKKAVFLAAGRVAPDEVVPVLARLAEHRSLWRSRERTERAEAALEALGRIGDRARPALEGRWKRKRPDLLARFERYLGHTAKEEAA